MSTEPGNDPRLALASPPEYVEDEGADWWDGYEAWLAAQPEDEDAYIAWMDEMSAREELPEASHG